MPLRRSLWVLLFFVSMLLAGARDALAHDAVLPGGREKDMLALFAPHALGAEVAAGYKLWSVSIQERRLVVGVRAADGSEVKVSLVHPDDEAAAKTAPRSTSFAAIRDEPAEGRAAPAIDALLGALQKNDHGGLWVELEAARAPPSSTAPETKPFARVSAWSSGTWSPIDGIAALAAFFALAALLAGRVLARERRWMALTLAAIVVIGAAVRLEIAPVSFLGAWPWSRVWPNVRAVAEGPALAAIAARVGHSFYLTDVMAWTNFGYAALMPLVLFAHATYLLRDPRAGLFAAFAVALLPQHIRFSRAEDAFVPSLVLTSLAFALIHAWLRDPSRIVRCLALAALPFVLYTGYLLRPLNMLFVAVFAAAILFLHPETATRARRITGLAVVIGVWLLVLPIFVSTNNEAVHTALVDPRWIFRFFTVIVSPRLFVLTDPRVTPLVLVVLALAGALHGFRGKERRLVAFLGGWLALFTVAHAFVIEPEMEPRYHLHLVVPFLLLGSIAAARAWKKERTAAYVAIGALCAAPFLHGAWISDLGYVEMQEYAFVRRARDLVPEGCTVLEYAGADANVVDLRFPRIGARTGVRYENRFRAAAAFAPGVSGSSSIHLEDVERNPPACLYIYEGLSCWSAKDAAEAYASTCRGFHEKRDTRIVLQAEAPLRIYDRRNTPPGALESPNVTFTLRRVETR